MKIKKILVAFLILSFLTFSVTAQQNKFVVGIDGGSGICSLFGKPDMPAISAGGVFQCNFSHHLSIVTGLGYDRISDRDLDNLPGLGGTLEVPATEHLHYLTLPVTVQASVGKKVLFFVNGGIFLSALLHAAEIDAAYTTPLYPGYVSSQKYTVNYNFNGADFGLIFGLGVSIPIRNNFAFILEERNNIGLINVLNEEGMDSYNIAGHTLSLVMLLGFTYSFGEMPRKIDKTDVKR